MCNPWKSKEKKEGIALVIVLAFLSILLTLAAALLIMTRTELLVSGMAKDAVVTEQLLHTAVALAVDEIDMALWPSNNIHIPKNLSIMLNGTKNCGTNVNLLKGSVTNWIPRQYLKNSDIDFNGSAKQCYWTAITNSIGQTYLIGRYSYMSFNCTGLLDANLVSQNDPPNPDYMGRMEGLSVKEVDIQYLPEFGTASKREDYRNWRDNDYYRFDAFPELQVVVSNKTAGIHLAPYSHCYDQGWFDWSGGYLKWRKPGELSADIVINGDVRAWTQADADTAFSDAGYGVLANQMALCFEDYVDNDFKPKSTDIPCCEPVPMINEITVSHGLRLANDMELTYFATVEVELWYPFVGTTNTKQYQVVIANTIAFNNNSPIQGRAGSSPPYSTFVMAKNPDPFDGNPCVPDPVVMADQGRSPQFITNSKVFNFTYDFPAPLVASDFPIEVRPRAVANFDITVQEAEGVIDHVAVSKRIILPPIVLDAPGMTSASDKWSLAVNDPRLNHLMDFSVGGENWDTPTEPTIGGVNKWNANFNRSINGDLEGTNMYVRNSTNLASVAELGYIPTGERWGTVDLFSEKGKKLLAKYRANDTLASIGHTNGFINPNTHFTNVLFAAFMNAPIDLYPNGPIQSVVDQFMARDLVSGMIEISSDPGTKGEESFDSPVGWVDNPALVAGGGLSSDYKDEPYYMDNNKKEAIIRNSYRLFNPNQILYVMVVSVQSINDKGTIGTWDDEKTAEPDIITGEKRAVALIWRDPFPNENGRNEWFIRQFKYLDE